MFGGLAAARGFYNELGQLKKDKDALRTGGRLGSKQPEEGTFSPVRPGSGLLGATRAGQSETPFQPGEGETTSPPSSTGSSGGSGSPSVQDTLKGSSEKVQAEGDRGSNGGSDTGTYTTVEKEAPKQEPVDIEIHDDQTWYDNRTGESGGAGDPYQPPDSEVSGATREQALARLRAWYDATRNDPMWLVQNRDEPDIVDEETARNKARELIKKAKAWALFQGLATQPLPEGDPRLEILERLREWAAANGYVSPANDDYWGLDTPSVFFLLHGAPRVWVDLAISRA